MKRVVTKNQTEITSEQANPLKIYVIFIDKSKTPSYILQFTQEGWIFKGADDFSYGHSGHHKTQKEAIDAALDCFSTDLQEFDNLLELINYCKT